MDTKKPAPGDAPSRILIVSHHHSDLVWRRTKHEYDRVRDEQILQVIEYLRSHPEFRFTFAQTDEVRTFLQQHPELRDEFKGYVADGQIELVGGMIGIPDTNLVCGESLVRNTLLGRQYLEQTFGEEVEIGWLMDAFGMSAQLPQIFAKSGFRYLYPGRMPGLPDLEGAAGFIWVGLDGSSIIVASEQAGIQSGTHVCNLPVTYSVMDRVTASLRGFRNVDRPLVFAMQCSEEGLFHEEVFELIGELNASSEEKPYCFAATSEYYQTLDPESLPQYQGELNPEFTGCYTSHIRVKHLNRSAENNLLTAEAILAIASLQKGQTYPTTQLDHLWERLCLWQFHDSICGCHTDAVADEACDDLSAIVNSACGLQERGLAYLGEERPSGETVVTLFNPCLAPRDEVVALELPDDFIPADRDGQPLPAQRDGLQTCVTVSAPPLGFTGLRRCSGTVSDPEVINSPEQLKQVRFETDWYQVGAEDGELNIQPKAVGEPVFEAPGFGEIMFREDGGDLWTEDYLGTALGSDYYRERIERVTRGPVFTRVHLLGEVLPGTHGHDHGLLWDGFEPFRWEKELTFYQALKSFHVKVSVIWQGRNTEIGIRFPLRVDPLKARATYAIPFGHLERQPYYEVESTYSETARSFPSSIYQRAKGNWPALGWVDYSDSRFGVTIANRGQPGHRLQNGVATVSLLRSPTRQASGFVPGLGSWENGMRTAEFGLFPHADGLAADSVAFGEAFNRPLRSHIGAPLSGHPSGDTPQSVLSVDCDGIGLTALKRSQDGNRLVARFCESLGREITATLSTGFQPEDCWLADLNENPQTPLTDLQLAFTPFEIKTVLFDV